MRYSEEQIEILAAEYVLGTLHGAARRRLDGLIRDRADVRFEVWRWERHLNGIARGLKPRVPAPHVWNNIWQRIHKQSAAPASRLSVWWRGFWLAVPMAAAAAWLAIALWTTPVAERIAVFADVNVETLWVVTANLDDATLRTEALNVPALADNSSFELWVLRTNAAPLSLGLLPVNAGTIESGLSTALIAALTDSGRLAISLEPAGGSPTGVPTGPVVYQAALISI